MNDMLRIGELEAALLQWKCPSCGGSGDYLNRTKDGAGYVTCKVCNGRGLHPVAYAALKPVLPEFHRGGLWEGQKQLDWMLNNALHRKRAGDPAGTYSSMRAASLVAEHMAHVEGRVFSTIPDYWFTYAGDGYARAYGIPTKASFLWPKHQRAIQAQKKRDAEASEQRRAALAAIPREPNEIPF